MYNWIILFLFLFIVKFINRYEDEDNGFLGFMIVVVFDKVKDERMIVGKFFVSVLIRIFVLKCVWYLYIKLVNYRV